MQRAKRARLDFALTNETLPHVVKVCRLVGGSPLAIELAAAWVRVMPVAEIAAEIARNLDFLEGGACDLGERHRSLRGAFEHSWRLLDARERKVLRKLSVFVGGFTREAASQVADATIPLLASLVDKSLLRVLEQARYDRHPLLYQYTQEKLAARPDELAEAKARHAAYFLTLAEAAEAKHRGPEQATWLARLEMELDNLRAALAWSLGGSSPETGLGLAVALYHFWYYHSHLLEGETWLARALEVAKSDVAWSGYRSRLLSALGVLASERGDDARALTLFEERLALARTQGDLAGQAAALNSMGIVAWHRQDYARAQRLIEASLALRRKLRQPESILIALNNLGLVALARNRWGEAEAYLEESLAMSREVGDDMGVAIAVSNLGAVALEHQDSTRAQDLLQDALARYRALGDQDGLAHCLEGLAAVAALQGRPAYAARLAGAAEALRERVGAVLSPSDRSRHERRLAPARAALDEAAFARAWQQGRSTPLEELVDALVKT